MWLVDPMIMILQLLFFFNTSSVKRGSCLLGNNIEWEPSEKPPNLMRKTKDENRGTNENILAP